jgi:hypothetical protein
MSLTGQIFHEILFTAQERFMAYCVCVERLQINQVTAVTVLPDREFRQCADLHFSLSKEMEGSCEFIVLGGL